MRNFLKKQKRSIITVAIIILVFAIVFSPLLIKEMSLINEDTSKMDIILNISQIISAIFVIVGTFIAVWQYYLSSKSNIIKLNTDRVQKAIDLSRYYKDEILYPYSMLKAVYVQAGITDILSKEKKKMKVFDDEEIHDIFSDKGVKEIERKLFSTEYATAIIELNQRYDFGLDICKEYENGDKKKHLTPKDCIIIAGSFDSKYRIAVMNNLEHFAMYFTHNVADESVVYQSLSPTYLEMCRVLYYNIAHCSQTGQPKLYRNLQQLYEIWNNKAESSKKDIRKREVHTGTVVENLK